MTNGPQFVERSFDTGQVVINYAETRGSGTPRLLLHGAILNWHLGFALTSLVLCRLRRASGRRSRC